MTVFSELRMRPVAATPAGWNASTTARLVISGAVIFMLLVGANLATPLYPLLQSSLGLSSLDVTAAFASYVLALVGTLLLAGHWSDHIGRRAALLVAVLTGLAGGWIFAEAQTLAGLCAGRALQGTAVALATGASAAALRELLPSRPEWASRFTLLASSGGVAAGPVIGGLLSLLPGATTAPYVVHSLLLAGLLVPLYLIRARPAIVAPAATRPLHALAPRRPSVSRQASGAFWLASGVGFLSFAVFGFSLSLAPGYFAQVLATDSRPLIGLLAGLPLGASAFEPAGDGAQPVHRTGWPCRPWRLSGDAGSRRCLAQPGAAGGRGCRGRIGAGTGVPDRVQRRCRQGGTGPACPDHQHRLRHYLFGKRGSGPWPGVGQRSGWDGLLRCRASSCCAVRRRLSSQPQPSSSRQGGGPPPDGITG